MHGRSLRWPGIIEIPSRAENFESLQLPAQPTAQPCPAPVSPSILYLVFSAESGRVILTPVDTTAAVNHVNVRI